MSQTERGLPEDRVLDHELIQTPEQQFILKSHSLFSLLAISSGQEYFDRSLARSAREQAIFLAHDPIYGDLIGSSPAWVHGLGNKNGDPTYEIWWRHLVSEGGDATHPVHLKVQLHSNLSGDRYQVSEKFLHPSNSGVVYPKPYTDAVKYMREELQIINNGGIPRTDFGWGIVFGKLVHDSLKYENNGGISIPLPHHLAKGLLNASDQIITSTHTHPSCTRSEPAKIIKLDKLPYIRKCPEGAYYYPQRGDSCKLFSIVEDDGLHKLHSSQISKERVEPILLRPGDTLVKNGFPNITVISLLQTPPHSDLV